MKKNIVFIILFYIVIGCGIKEFKIPKDNKTIDVVISLESYYPYIWQGQEYYRIPQILVNSKKLAERYVAESYGGNEECVEIKKAQTKILSNNLNEEKKVVELPYKSKVLLTIPADDKVYLAFDLKFIDDGLIHSCFSGASFTSKANQLYIVNYIFKNNQCGFSLLDKKKDNKFSPVTDRVEILQGMFYRLCEIKKTDIKK